MKKYEYKLMETPVVETNDDFIQWLNWYGNSGWEFIEMANGELLFKREID